ncbi:neuraminidase-like domain-containing protein [Plantactinospora siamensis]|uniref:Neuraminidase-like domain-containing protein n=1 Tax=Plantactinospora siamensis TaxID=555372 RepID=A0ABV6P604_9ACTN
MPALEPTDLLTLHRLSGATLPEIQRQDERLYGQLAEAAGQERRSTVLTQFSGASEGLRDRLGRLDYTPQGDGGDLAELVLRGLRDQQADRDAGREAAERLVELNRSGTLDDPAALDTPISDHPLFQAELGQATVVRLAVSARVPVESAGRVLGVANTAGELNDAAVRTLVDKQVLPADQADSLGRVVTLYHLTGDTDRAEALHRGLAADVLPDKAGPAAMAGLGPEGWSAVIARGKVAVPEGLTEREYADHLDHAISGLFPTDALLSRATAEQGPLRGTPAETVYRRNPGVELLTLDYGPDSADLDRLDFGDLDPDRRGEAVADLKAYQRMFALTDRTDHAYTLLRGDFRDATSIAALRPEKFAAISGLAEKVALDYHAAARGTLANVTTAVASIIDVIRGGFDDLKVSNLLPSVQDYLKRLDGYSDLFGSQDFCDCSHCQSILGPAAYFVDLMTFVSEHVSEPYFSGAKANDPLHLRVRRPDLWTLPLTCENTNTLVPWLDIINTICENFLANRTGFGGDLTDRGAVEEHVYHQRLAVATGSFQQPFTLPLARLSAYLGHFELSRVAVARAYGAPARAVAAAALGVSSTEYDLLVTPHADTAFLSRVYGVAFSVDGAGAVAPLDVQPLLAATGLDRDTFGALVGTAFVTAGGTEPVQLVTAKSTPDAVQNDVERAQGLRLTSLDRLHRLARLVRRLPWSVAETDLLLAQLRPGDPGRLDAAVLTDLLDVLDVHARFALPAEQNSALWAPVPTVALPGASGSLFDRLFNLPTYVRLDGTLPKPGVSFVHPSLRSEGVPNPADNTLHRLLAAVGLPDDQFAALILALSPALGADPAAADEDDRGFALTAANLTLLYRHARLAKLLRVDAADLAALIGVAGLAGGAVTDRADLGALLAAVDWWRASGYRLDDLAVATGGTPRQPARYPAPAEVATAVATSIAADNALRFADTVFAFVPGVTEDQSRAIIAANAAAVRPSADGAALRLAADFDPAAPLTVPAGVTAAEPDLRAALLAHHAGRVLPPRLATALHLAADRVSALAALAGADLGAAALVEAVQGGPIGPLVDLVATLVPLSVAFAGPAYDPAALAFLAAHPDVFGVSDYTALTVPALRRLGAYARFDAAIRAAVAVTGATDDAAAAAVEAGRVALRQVLGGFVPGTGFPANATGPLGVVLGAQPALVATVLPHLSLPAAAPAALEVLARAVDLASRLGVGGDVLALIVSDDYGQQTRAGEALLSAARARYPDEREFADRLAPAENQLRGQRRDALCDYLVRSLSGEFGTVDDIYEYLLVDVRLEGCAQTSWLVAAISSVQLYLHRVLAGLEQDRRDPGDPARTAVPADAVPADEWQWRKNYRVWEANRKVFLWPENYLEPELRDDKTPLFADLESALMQQQITPQNVLDAYAGYLDGFDELAGLRVAGVYHDKDAAARTDVLHLFGVTPADPPVYYYRTVENAYYGELSADRQVSYGPWRKISVQIPVRHVSPIVYLNRLFVFWTEVTTTTKNEVKDGASTFVGYRHRLTLKYTTLRLDGRWSPPQGIALIGAGFPNGDGVVDDPLGERIEYDRLAQAVSSLDFVGIYQQTLALATPRYDTKVHSEPIDGYTLKGLQWDRVYPIVDPYGRLKLTMRNFTLSTGVDFYTRRIATLPPALFGIDLASLFFGAPDRTAVSTRPEGTGWGLYLSHPAYRLLDAYPQASVVADARYLDALAAVYETAGLAGQLAAGLYTTRLGTLTATPEVTAVNGSPTDAIVDLTADQLYVQTTTRPGPLAVVKRLSTTLGPRMSRTLFAGGVSSLLATPNQLALGEANPPLSAAPGLADEVVRGRIDWTGPYGTYYREIFFHIPFLLANHLNGQGDFQAAQGWYRYIFDPAAAETIAVPPGTPPAEAARRQRDRVWRYAEFRGLDAPTLREVLTDPAAIEAYRKDPFNPHAIARQRLSAYQKSIVMKYVDNLLDWGDSLFTAFTTESVNEATMLYVEAADILGRRPARLGSCGEGAVQPRTYEKIAPLVKAGSPFLVELEHVLWFGTRVPAVYGTRKRSVQRVIDPDELRFFTERATPALRLKQATVAVAAGVRDRLDAGAAGLAEAPELRRVVGRAAVRAGATAGAGAAEAGARADVPAEGPRRPVELAGAGLLAAAGAVAAARQDAAQAVLTAQTPGLSRFTDWREAGIGSWAIDQRRAGGERTVVAPTVDGGRWRTLLPPLPFGWHIVRQFTPVFCVPANADLLAYWDRVDDRLYKLRHCLDITGTPRQLALFAPEIDPRLLVRARAAGLSIDEALGAGTGDLPPYRFSYLIERARQHAAVVQGFGAALQSALERKDAEELNRLYATNQQNLLAMSTRLREWEIELATSAVDTLNSQIDSVSFRRNYYASLLDDDLNAGETIQSVAKNVAAVSFVAGSLLQGTAGVLSLIPELGSPFAMKYGGVALGSSLKGWGAMASDTAKLAEVVSAAAGLAGGFARRREGWQFQRDLADNELKQLAKQAQAAAVRQKVANRSLEVHNRQVEQQQEVLDLMGSRFTGLGLYTWLASTLQRLFREAFNNAYATARLAEQAYRFERGDETTPLLRGGYFDPTRAGLLAGEQLMMDLEAMERRFIETNYRTPEVDQAFSLAQIDPAALVRLRQTGECAFDLPEVFFDLFYPGQYRRRTKAVRLTIPSVTGPYTNVGATLELTGSKIRKDPVPGAAGLQVVPLRRSVAIATSTAQHDTGVFEFSFRDERYMPFEGAGAVSSWRLTLPKTFRPFDYETITDVIIHLSYTAEQDGVLRGTVEQANAALDGTIMNHLATEGLARVYGLRQDFSTAFNRLLHSPANTPVRIALTDRHLPIFLRGRELTVTTAKLVLRTPPGQTVSGVSVGIDATVAGGFTRDPALADLYTADVTAAFAAGLLGERTLTVRAAGDLAPSPQPPGDPSAVDDGKLLDVLLYLEVTLA